MYIAKKALYLIMYIQSTFVMAKNVH